MTKKTENGRRAVLYARVSTRGQAEEGFSLRQQIETLREWCEREGYEVLEVVTDAGHSGARLERPGLDRVRDLTAAGGVSVVVAQDADRITRDPIHRGFLDDEFERRGTRLLALDDWGDDSHQGQLLRFMKGWVAKGERLTMAERSRRGKLRKVREGKLIRGPRAPYGFSYTADHNGLVVKEPEMGVMRRIFEMIGVEGLTMGEVQRRLDGEAVPPLMANDPHQSTSGRWHKSTIRKLVLNELYRPLTVEEIAASALIKPEVISPPSTLRRSMGCGLTASATKECGESGAKMGSIATAIGWWPSPGRSGWPRRYPSRTRASRGRTWTRRGSASPATRAALPRLRRAVSGNSPAGSSGAASAAAR
jgi:DNA invertase Pin-like site-specific DNA recombinase